MYTGHVMRGEKFYKNPTSYYAEKYPRKEIRGKEMKIMAEEH